MSILYKLQTILLQTIGDVQCFGWKSPFWFAFKTPGYRIKGEHYRIIEPLLKPGDVLLQRYEGWINKWFIPGFWNHSGIYVGNNNIVHAISEGVLVEDIINFMRTDHLMVLRTYGHLAHIAIININKIIGAEYDFKFDFTNSRRFSCTELIDYCYPGTLKRRSFFGRPTIVPDDIVNNNHFSIIWNSLNSATGKIH